MKAATHLHAGARRVAVAAVAATLLAAAVLCVGAAAPAAAPAATVSGALKGAVGYKVLLVQANGRARKATIRTSAGSFSITGGKPAGATLQLVRPDGSYFGPVVLKATATKALTFIKGTAGLKLGVLVLKAGYATARRAPLGRYQTLAAYTAKAVNGKPVGAGKLGPRADGEADGPPRPRRRPRPGRLVSAFDIDDNGNLCSTTSTGPAAATAGRVPPARRRPRSRPCPPGPAESPGPAAARHHGAVLPVLQLLADGGRSVDLAAGGVDQREHRRDHGPRRAHRPVSADGALSGDGGFPTGPPPSWTASTTPTSAPTRSTASRIRSSAATTRRRATRLPASSTSSRTPATRAAARSSPARWRRRSAAATASS